MSGGSCCLHQTSPFPKKKKSIFAIIFFCKKGKKIFTILLSKLTLFLKELNPDNLTNPISSFASYRQLSIDSLFNITAEGDIDMFIKRNSISKFYRKHVPHTYFNISTHVPLKFYYLFQEKTNAQLTH